MLGEYTAWAGSQESADYAAWALQQIAANSLDFDAAVIRSTGSKNQEAEKPYQLHGSTAILSVKGPMVNSDSPYLKAFGVVGYPQLKRDLMAAAADPAVNHILLDIHSGGGQVAGIEDVSATIKKIDGEIKPITAHTSGSMYSAAYWVGSSARAVHATRTAGVGSIGVITTHYSYAKQLANDGVEATVIRAGKYKALASPVEPLSEEAKAQITGQLDALYGMFVQHVADNRGVSYATADSTMAQGREFLGEQAKVAGLIDSVASLDSLLSTLQTEKIDNGNLLRNNHLRQQGVSHMSAEAQADASTQSNDETTAENTAETTAAATETGQTAVVAMLQGQLSAANEQVFQLRVTNDGLTARLSSYDKLVAIATESLSRMRVALGLSAIEAGALSTEALLAEHERTAVDYAKFPVGGVARTTQDPEQVEASAEAGATKAEVVQMTPAHKAQINAVRMTKRI